MARQRHQLPEEPASWLDPQVNWVWLARPARWDRVLVVGIGAGSWAAGLRGHFAWVHCLTGERAGGDLEQAGACSCGTASMLPFRSASFDCVAYSEALDAQTVAALRGQRRILEEGLRVLRPGGMVYCSSPNPLHFRVLFRRFVLGTRTLKNAGFRTVCDYYADPSLERARSIVPARRHPAGVMELITGTGTTRDRLRRSLAFVGLHSLLYRWRIFLAYK